MLAANEKTLHWTPKRVVVLGGGRKNIYSTIKKIKNSWVFVWKKSSKYFGKILSKYG